MRVVLVETLRGLRVVTSTVGIEMTAPPIMTMGLVAADGTTASIASITLVSSVVIIAVALGATTACLRRVAVSTTSTIVVARLLLAVLLSRIISFVLVLVLSDLLVLELHRPLTSEVVAELVRIQRIVWINWINFLVVCQPILHLSRENVPNKLQEFGVST